MFTHGQTWQRLRRKTVVDRYSREETLADWTDPDTEPIDGCGFAPGTSEEFPEVDREQLHTVGTLYVTYQADITAGDRMKAPDGEDWQVIGDRADWRNPLTGWTAGSVVRLKRVRG